MAHPRTRDAAPEPATRPLSARRRLLFTAVMLAAPWLLLALLELGLRAGGYGDSYPLFVRHPVQTDYLVPNEKIGRRYFRGSAFAPTPEREFFLAGKPPRGFRVFFQGESSAQGFPYGHGGAPSRMLEQRLAATFPGRDVEVVNTALTAVNSYTLLDQADEILAQRPDAVLIYTGHNEYYGAFGVGSTGSFAGRRPLVKAYLALRELRVAQLAANAIDAGASLFRSSRPDEAPRTVMELMAGDQHIAFGSPTYRAGLEQFRANLDELLRRYRAAGVPVLIGTIASNERDQPPFVTAFAAGADSARWRRHHDAGVAALGRGELDAARRELAAALAVDSTAAATRFALGRTLEAHGDTAGARAAYRAAKEYDQLRFRAPEAINAIIRETAARHGATVVETQRALERASPGGIVGGTLMLEHLHPNLDGYFIVADAFYEAMRERAMIEPRWPAPVPASAARAEIPVTPLDSLAGLYRTDRLVSGWPFRARGEEAVPIVDTLRARGTTERLAQAVVLGMLPWPEATERLRDDAERSGDYDGAIRAARALAQEYGYSPEPWVDAARAAMLQRRYDDAMRYARLAEQRQPTARGAQLFGLLLLRAGERDAALHHLRRATQLARGDDRLLGVLRAAEALPSLERAREIAPQEPQVLFDLATAYAMTLQHERARDALAALRRVDPSHDGARLLAARLPE